MSFPQGFVWGAAAAAYQIEGAAADDGRGPSIWDEFCIRPGAIKHGDDGRVACDHYHRFEDDVALMSEMGLQAYRLSISWPRLLPEGTGSVNAPGVAFYDRLIDTLLAAGIDPWVTLFHWDLPLALERRGGWRSRECIDWFGEYTAVVVDALSDRVTHWMPINEPQVFLAAGHDEGWHAPGLKLSRSEQLLAVHHNLLAFGRSVDVIRARARKPASVGCALQCLVKYPATESEPDQAAAREAFFDVAGDNLWNTAWFADPLFLGHYPEAGLRAYGDAVPAFTSRELEQIHRPLDFCGLNIYGGDPVRAGADGSPEQLSPGPGAQRTTFGWLVAPPALRFGPRFAHERYAVPIVITENGLANIDWVSEDGRVHDPQRIDFTQRYLRALHQALLDGVDVQGYFHWSVLDNFEWAEGYTQRFGLIHVDYETLARTPKDSARWFREVIASHGACLGLPAGGE